MLKVMRDHSYGIAPVSQTIAGRKYLLVHQLSGNWSFPKGHKHRGESDLSAAMRELAEETGINEIEVLKDISFTGHYTIKRPLFKIRKSITIFIGSCNEKEPLNLQSGEIAAAKWCSLLEAASLLAYPETKRLLLDIETYLNQDNIHSGGILNLQTD